jgi:recombination protein RecT
MSAENKQVTTIEDKVITNQVLAKINQFQQSGELTIPNSYSPENALKSAWLILQETVDINKKPVLESCTKMSIANCLLDMVVQGLSPIKKQCFFIAYGNKLQLSRSYLGAIAVAKRVGGVKEVRANCIFDGDDFDYEIDVNTGRLKILKHKPSLENIDTTKIKGAYAVVIYNDDSTSVEIMNMTQIKSAWNQGKAKGNSPAHQSFSDEMAKKTVINRALKTVIGSSDDSGLYDEKELPSVEERVSEEIEQNANVELIDFDEAVVMAEKTNVVEPVVKVQKKAETLFEEPTSAVTENAGAGF